MTPFDLKIKQTFPEESVYKVPERYGVFMGKNLPSFIRDWLMKKFTDEFGELDADEMLKFIDEHIPHKDDHIKGELIKNSEEQTLLTRILIEPDIKSGKLRFEIPEMQIKFSEGEIPNYVAQKYPELKGGEVWGIVTLAYFPPQGKEKGVIQLIRYTPFKPYEVDLEYYRTARKEYSTEEWIDLLIRSMEYNPDGFMNLTQKLCFLSRLMIFVEPRLNMIELAPKGTGKSYIFGNLSKYGWIISGGTVTRAKLFYDVARNAMGLITLYDFVAMDEIETIKFSDDAEMQGALKNYLESGVFTVAQFRQTSNAGMMLLGNIALDHELQPLSEHYFTELPSSFQESALLDRFHGFIEGWRLPRINESLKVRGYTLNVEYFSEILHSLREASDCSAVIDDLLEIERQADTRDTTAIKRCASAYLKLLFPHVKSSNDISKTDFEIFCLQPAIEKRRIIRHQIHLIDKEFKETLPEIKLKE